MWYAEVRIAPAQDLFVLVAANRGVDFAEKPCGAAAEALIRDHAARKDR